MNIHKFKLAQKSLQDNISESDIELSSLNEFMNTKYSIDDAINEGFFSSIVSWFKKNFSSTAINMKKLGKDYYKWLTDEYTATYKKDKWSDTPLEQFLKKETPSNDIETQIITLAKEDPDYLELGKKIILENKIKAKRVFCEKQVGADDRLTKQYVNEEKEATKEVERMGAKMSEKERAKFSYNYNELKKYIENSGQNAQSASLLATGLSIFAQNRKLAKGAEYSMEDLTTAYDNVEKKYFELNPKMNNEKGIAFILAARKSKSKKSMEYEDLEEFTVKVLENMITSTYELLAKFFEEFGLDIKDQWGNVEVYLNIKDAESQKAFLNSLRTKLKGLSKEDATEYATEVEKEYTEIVDKHLDADVEAEKITTLATKLEKVRTEVAAGGGGGTGPSGPSTSAAGGGGGTGPSDSSVGATAEGATSEGATAETKKPIPDKVGPVGQKLIDSVKARPVHLLEGIKDYILALSTAVKKGDKNVWNPMYKNTVTAIKSGLNNTSSGISQELIDRVLIYLPEDRIVKDRSGKSIGFKGFAGKPEYNEEKIKAAATALFSDYSLGLRIWDEKVEVADEDTLKDLASKDFFATLFKDKQGSDTEWFESAVREKMGKTFEYYL